MTDLEVLKDIEALKQLKARYCRLLDAKDWSAWRTLFTNDFVSDTTASGGKRVEGGDAFVDFVRSMLGTRTTVHQVHAPEIQVLAPDRAQGIWALEDVVRLAPGLTMRGYGHYHEAYVKHEGQWRFASSTLTRLRADLETPIARLKLPARLLAKG